MNKNNQELHNAINTTVVDGLILLTIGFCKWIYCSALNGGFWSKVDMSIFPKISLIGLIIFLLVSIIQSWYRYYKKRRLEKYEPK